MNHDVGSNVSNIIRAIQDDRQLGQLNGLKFGKKSSELLKFIRIIVIAVAVKRIKNVMFKLFYRLGNIANINFGFL